MSKTRILTGITTSGTPHLGNYVGAIRPAIEASKKDDVESFFFLADYHALIKTDDPARIQRSTLEIAATWLACGLDPEKVYFYRQSDIPEIPELTWLLTCVTSKGLLNRAHAYKAANDANREKGDDADAGVTAGLYMYPVLMAADILIFNANKVPVGRDQVQHIEMARDIGQRFNHIYGGDYFVLPEAVIGENVATLPGLDGRKMSKSYNNTIPLFDGGEEALGRAIMGMVTDSTRPNRIEETKGSALYQLIAAFDAGGELMATIASAAEDLGGWGAMKRRAIKSVNDAIGSFRGEYERLISNPQEVEDKLRTGAQRVRKIAAERILQMRQIVGLRNLVRPSKSGEQIEKKSSTAEKKGKFVPPYREGGNYKFRLENARGKVLFISREYVVYSDAAKGLNSLRGIELSDVELGPLYLEGQAMQDLLLKENKELLGAVLLNSNPSGFALQSFFEELAAMKN